jgi:hypothetical protein
MSFCLKLCTFGCDNRIVLLGKHFVSPGQVCFHIGEAEREDWMSLRVALGLSRVPISW